MGWISITFVHKFVKLAAAESGDRARLFRAYSVDPDAPIDPKVMISDAAFFDMLEQLAERTPAGRNLALRVGASMSCDEYGAFGLAFKTAANLTGSYKRVERYGRIITSIANFRVVELGGDSLLFEVIPAITARAGIQMTHELALAAALALSREVSREPFSPRAVHIAHAKPTDISAFHEVFQCPVTFDTGHDALVVTLAHANQPNRLADAGISAFFENHLARAVAELPEEPGFIQKVRDHIMHALPEGVPKLDQIARQMGMSGRTLQRRLAATEYRFGSLVEHAQQTLADKLLRTTNHTMMDIAFLTGFTDQSTFARAFKRRNGITPSEHRRKSETSTF